MGRVSPMFVLKKAQEIPTEVLREMHRSGQYVEMPMIDKCWLRRWRRDYGVSFRRPNQRYKCSRRVLEDRLRTMWLNCIRVRRAAQRLLGHDLQYAIYGIDETPFHMNESGSKNIRRHVGDTGSACCEVEREPRSHPPAHHGHDDGHVLSSCCPAAAAVAD